MVRDGRAGIPSLNWIDYVYKIVIVTKADIITGLKLLVYDIIIMLSNLLNMLDDGLSALIAGFSTVVHQSAIPYGHIAADPFAVVCDACFTRSIFFDSCVDVLPSLK